MTVNIRRLKANLNSFHWWKLNTDDCR